MKRGIEVGDLECKVKLDSWLTKGGLRYTGLPPPVGQSELGFCVARRAKKTGSKAHRRCLPRGKAAGLLCWQWHH